MKSKRPARRLMAMACVLTIPIVLAACSSGGTKSSSATTTSTTPTKVTSPQSPRFVVTNNDAARKDARLSSCQDVHGSWVAKGTVTNSLAKTATYSLQITYTDAQDTVLGLKVTKVSPASKKSAEWTTSWPSKKTTGVVCVLDAVSRN
jgi:hypothetical protein